MLPDLTSQTSLTSPVAVLRRTLTYAGLISVAATGVWKARVLAVQAEMIPSPCWQRSTCTGAISLSRLSGMLALYRAKTSEYVP